MSDVVCDIETQSLVDLRSVGARRYINDPSTRLMMLVCKERGASGLWHAWTPYCPYDLQLPSADEVCAGPEIPKWLLDYVQSGRRFIGHNCDSFDAPFLRRHYAIAPEWYDTIYTARASGLPGSLDMIGKCLGCGRKDEEGGAIMRLLCAAKSCGGGRVVYPVGSESMWRRLLEYNIQDVALTEQVFEECGNREEAGVIAVHRAVNDRGVRVDVDWLRGLLDLWTELGKEGTDRLAELTGGELTESNVRSVPQVRRWLHSQGLRLDSLNQSALTAFYDCPEEFLGDADVSDKVLEVLRLRGASSRAMRGKLVRLAESVETDSRVRDWAVYYGAHTGRWTSRRVQLHNMASRIAPRDRSSCAKLDVEAILDGPRTLARIRTVSEGFDADAVLAYLTRSVLVPGCDHVFGILDYSAVEAVMTALLAGEERLLSAFRDTKREVYCEFASKIFGRPIAKADGPERMIGKVCVLGMQYGMGARRFEGYAGAAGLDLGSLGLCAEDLVRQYRETYRRIVNLWRDVEDQLFFTLRCGHGSVCLGRVCLDTVGGSLLVTLPSGRICTYRDCRVERGVPGYCRLLGLAPFEKDIVKYRSTRGHDVELFGSRMVENIAQACCRDLLAGSLVALERTLYKPVLHAHDEIVCEIPLEEEGCGLEEIGRLMSSPPGWAHDMPLRVKGFTAPRYVKEPWKDSICVDYLGGKRV